MHRVTLAVAGAVALLGTQLGVAHAEVPLCGPPNEEVPATIVGAGLIVGTSGDDVIVGSSGADTILAGGGDDIVCGEGGDDFVDGGQGDDELIGDGINVPPFIPSNGANDDTQPLRAAVMSRPRPRLAAASCSEREITFSSAIRASTRSRRSRASSLSLVGS